VIDFKKLNKLQEKMYKEAVEMTCPKIFEKRCPNCGELL